VLTISELFRFWCDAIMYLIWLQTLKSYSWTILVFGHSCIVFYAVDAFNGHTYTCMLLTTITDFSASTKHSEHARSVDAQRQSSSVYSRQFCLRFWPAGLYSSEAKVAPVCSHCLRHRVRKNVSHGCDVGVTSVAYIFTQKQSWLKFCFFGC